MSNPIIKGRAPGWRPYRFPPSAAPDPQLTVDPLAVQQAIDAGFEQGNQAGYSEGLRLGRQDGEHEGREMGRRQGLADAQAEGREAFERASQPLDSLHQQLRTFLDGFEQRRQQQLLELVRKVAQQVIRCELTLHPTQLLTLAEDALAALPDAPQEVRILLNPEEHGRIKALAPERAAAWRLVPDEGLALGECRIVTAQEEIDIGCQQRLDACVDTLAEHVPAGKA